MAAIMRAQPVTPPLRTSSTMSSRKLLALQFIRNYWAANSGSPSLLEIAAGLDISKQHAHRYRRQLTAEGYITHVPGQPRSIRLASSATTHPGAMHVTHMGLPILPAQRLDPGDEWESGDAG